MKHNVSKRFLFKGNMISDYLLKLWSNLLSNQNILNTSSVFSYEIMSNVYFEICSLYSILFYNPQEYFIQNSSKEMKTLLEMIDNFCLTSQLPSSLNSTNVSEESSNSIVIRMKFLVHLLEEESFFDICNKNMQNFEPKLINFFIYAYLNNYNNNGGSNATNSKIESNNGTAIEKELNTLSELLTKRVKLFRDMNICSGLNVELTINNFIEKYGKLLKQTSVINKPFKIFQLLKIM
jgi:hypothetical protein